MPSTTSDWPKNGPTKVTSTYAVRPMKATSIAPPMPTAAMDGGRPVANVVIAPVSRSTRRTRPALPSVTYSAPSGPTVLPEPQPPTHPDAANVASSRTVGVCGCRLALAADGAPTATKATTATINNARLESMIILPIVGRRGARAASEEDRAPASGAAVLVADPSPARAASQPREVPERPD